MKLKYTTQTLVLITFYWVAFSASAITIAGVSVEYGEFSPAQGQEATLHYRIDEKATVTVSIFDSRDLRVRFKRFENRAAGEYRWNWNGTDQAGRPVPAEAYHYTIVAETAHEKAEYDLTDLSGGESVRSTQVIWNAAKGKIEYTLPNAARVAIRVGLKNNGPLLNNIIDWVPRSAGHQAEAWDGWDASGVLDLHNHPALELNLNAFALPRNTLLVVQPPTQQPSSATTNQKKAPRYVQDLPWGEMRRLKKKTSRPRIHDPSQLSATGRGDFPLQLSLVGDFPRDKSGAYRVSGIVPVRLQLEPQYVAQLASKRFEPVYFVDGQFVFENEVGYFPTTYLWNSDQHNPGEHYITANLRGYLGNFGMATVKVLVERSDSQTTATKQ